MAPSMSTRAEALQRLENDEDIQEEGQQLLQATAQLNMKDSNSSNVRTTGGRGVTEGLGSSSLAREHMGHAPKRGGTGPAVVVEHIRLNWRPGQGGHQPSADTRRLLQQAGGRAGMMKFTNLFYQKAFQDPHIDKFIREHSDPHGTRFADWITEKFGEGQPWTNERAGRKTCPFHSHGYQFESPHDRSSAHFAAWHSPKREPEKFGLHFKLDDCRVWMRLHFWAMRESGVWEASPSFADYYCKFIGHFVSVYERTATNFVRESARWSSDPENIQRYKASGNRMEPGLFGMPLRDAMRQLPLEERNPDDDWPYC